MLYIVTNLQDGELEVCYEGQKPFIGDKKRAKELADFCKSINPAGSYMVQGVKPATYVGKIQEKYASAQVVKFRARG